METETKVRHTPGPWACRYTARQDGNGGGYRWTIHNAMASDLGDGQAIATIGYGTAETKEANARLIAAAPDLLEVAHQAKRLMLEIEANMDNGLPDDSEERELFDNARAAIAKATGTD